MRIVFANLVERILSMPGTPTGKIPDGTVLAMRMFEATAYPWIREDQKFLAEIKAANGSKSKGDTMTLARWTAVLAGLQRAQMLDKAQVPYDNLDEDGDDAGDGDAAESGAHA